MMTVKNKEKPLVVAAICRSCDRVLKRSTQDTDQAAFKRAKWGQPIGNSPIAGVCRNCRKHGKG